MHTRPHNKHNSIDRESHQEFSTAIAPTYIGATKLPQLLYSPVVSVAIVPVAVVAVVVIVTVVV